jgi:hypothetical protein
MNLLELSKTGRHKMFKKITMILVTTLTILIFNSVETSAQTRIRFAAGRSSATVGGTIYSGDFKEFVVRARAGQRLIATVSSGNGKVVIANNYKSRYSLALNEDGDYTVQITNTGSTTRYRFTITIIRR